VFPGTDIPVHYEVADGKPTARRHDMIGASHEPDQAE
jgi:hypothetical protein